jgi:hypothetical protein
MYTTFVNMTSLHRSCVIRDGLSPDPKASKYLIPRQDHRLHKTPSSKAQTVKALLAT